jgi:hypothetical protein
MAGRPMGSQRATGPGPAAPVLSPAGIPAPQGRAEGVQLGRLQLDGDGARAAAGRFDLGRGDGSPEPGARCPPGGDYAPRSSPRARTWISYPASQATWSQHRSHRMVTGHGYGRRKETRPLRERETGQPGFSLRLPDAGRPGFWVRGQRGGELVAGGAQGLLVGFFARDEVDQGLCLVVGEWD